MTFILLGVGGSVSDHCWRAGSLMGVERSDAERFCPSVACSWRRLSQLKAKWLWSVVDVEEARVEGCVWNFRARSWLKSDR